MSIGKLIRETLLPHFSDSESFVPSAKKVNTTKKSAPIVYNVTSYYEIEPIASNLFAHQSIIINLSSLETKDKYRVIDFLSGVAYCLKATRTKLEENIYLFSTN